jgi:nitroimidazol reductase NimA-like FMN-containing flavoprotein (pyridoxamine 5'-phosphate oxidase superfamily)
MPSRRDIIRMTPDEVSAYLAAQRRMIIVTNGPGGFPHPVPMNYGVDDGGRIIITTFAKSQKIKNLERDPRASLLVESGAAYAEMKSVIIYAQAEIIRDLDLAAEARHFIRADKAIAISRDSARQEQIDASMAKRVSVRFTPERIVSWDHSKLGQFY